MKIFRTLSGAVFTPMPLARRRIVFFLIGIPKIPNFGQEELKNFYFIFDPDNAFQMLSGVGLQMLVVSVLKK